MEVDDAAPASAASPKVGKRVRKKTIDLYKIDTPPKDKKSTAIVPGDGIELGSIENVAEQIAKTKADDLQLLARFLFGAPGTKQDRKKKIRQFSGFQEDEIAKKTKFLAGQKTLAPLKTLAGLLDVQVVGPKNASGYRAALIEFGCKPTESGKGPAKKAAAAKRPAKAAKKGKAPAGKGKKRAPARKKKKKISAAALASVKAARGSRYLYAQSVKAEVKEENPDASKPELLKLIKEQYDALSDTDRTKFQRLAAKDVKRFNDAVAEFDEESEDEDVSESEEEDDDDSEYEEEDDEEPPNKKKKIEPEESSDEEPHETGTFPTDKQIKKRIRRIVRSADLTVMTKKTVRADAAKFFGVNLDEKKNLIKEVITVTVDAIE